MIQTGCGGGFRIPLQREDIETKTGRPVISGNQTLVRALLSSLGVRKKPTGFGRLLA